MTKRSSSMFDDLASLETTEVEAMYEQVIGRLSEAEETLVGLHVQKKLHSETIKFAVNKLTTAPRLSTTLSTSWFNSPYSKRKRLMQPSRSETNLFSGWCSRHRSQHFDGFLHQTHDR